MNLTRSLLCSMLLCSGLAAAQASTAWDEAVSGDLSNQGTSPTVVTLLSGSNIIRGATGRTGGVVDRDYFTFDLAAGLQLDSLTVLPGTNALGTSGLSFIAIQAGPQVTVDPTGGSPAGLMGWAHYGENDLGTDILGLMGIGMGANGFDVPLPAGQYSFWIQDTGTGIAAYNFDFGVSAVPEPSAAWLMMGGMALMAGLGARRRR
jgi:hypothetical protein